MQHSKDKTHYESHAYMRLKKSHSIEPARTTVSVQAQDIAKIHRKDRLFAVGICILLILVAISLMMIFFNVLIRMY